MATVKPFKALRPNEKYAVQVSSLPYDVISEDEAREISAKNPLSFMKVVRPEVNFAKGAAYSGDELYLKARDIISDYKKQGIFISDEDPCFYIYRLISRGRVQSGLVGCFACDDYINGTIKQHEQTRKSKEEDRIRHIDICNANTGLVYLAYKKEEKLKKLLENAAASSLPVYDFTASDGVRHMVWKISDAKTIAAISLFMEEIPSLYIADGHHRAASAAEICKKRRAENPGFTGDEEFNYFMAVAFASDELLILPYYRVVKDLNGLSADEFIKKLEEKFEVSAATSENTFADENGTLLCSAKGEMLMYLEGRWYRLLAKKEILRKDAVGVLDVSLLQDNILSPILGIDDPRTSERIDFVGGIRKSAELEKRCHADMQAAFVLYPTSMDELMAVADAGLFMPPKSTWFEPKLQSGLFVHEL